MSWISFNNNSRQLQLFAGRYPGVLASQLLGTFAAHNQAASSSNGKWPFGTYRWSHYNTHIDQKGFGPGCFATAYGCNGIHVFSVKGRTGMGVHAGRVGVHQIPAAVGGVTLGCIRTSEAAMTAINDTHRKDPLVAVIVSP